MCGYDGNIDQAGIGDMCDYRVDKFDENFRCFRLSKNTLEKVITIK